VVPALTCAWHAVVPSQRVSPVALLLACCPCGPATAVELPVTLPVHPASGHTICEVLCPLPDTPGTGRSSAPSPATWPESRPMDVLDSLAATHPDAAEVQVAVVVDSPGTPDVVPVVVTVQPGPAHSPVAADCDIAAGASVTGLLASSAASVAALRASCAAAAASVANFFSSAVAPCWAATRAASAASCSTSVACCCACSAASFCCSAIMSATTWPDPAVELLCARQPDWPLVQVALVVETPSGGPRAPLPVSTALGPSLPAADVRVVPEQAVLPAQSNVADAIVQLDAPATVGPPEFALDPGAVGAGGVAGWS
jgi:hypothetical protein